MMVKIFVVAIAIGGAASAESFEQCMTRKISEGSDRKTVEIFHDRGCTTDSTKFVVDFNFTGWKVDDCNEALCWDAPPGYYVVSSEGKGGSAVGSRHSWSGPIYRPHQQNAAQVCFSVYARGPDQDQGARGWQKVDATATIERILEPSFAIVAARECASETGVN